MRELTAGLAEYFRFYNGEREHQSLLENLTPDVVYQTAIGGGAVKETRYTLMVTITTLEQSPHISYKSGPEPRIDIL